MSLNCEEPIMPRRLIRSAVRKARRTAAIAGTAGVLSGRAMDHRRHASARRPKHHQAGRAAPGADRGTAHRDAYDLASRLHQLADLKAMGALTEKEFAAAKSKLLND
jgi:Short C-terminal domain